MVHIDRTDGTRASFRIIKVETYREDTFDTVGVYGDTPNPELRLITGGGVFDEAANSYPNTVVMFAVLADPR